MDGGLAASWPEKRLRSPGGSAPKLPCNRPLLKPQGMSAEWIGTSLRLPGLSYWPPPSAGQRVSAGCSVAARRGKAPGSWGRWRTLQVRGASARQQARDGYMSAVATSSAALCQLMYLLNLINSVVHVHLAQLHGTDKCILLSMLQATGHTAAPSTSALQQPTAAVARQAVCCIKQSTAAGSPKCLQASQMSPPESHRTQE